MRGFIGGLSLLGMLLIQTGCSEDEVTPPRQAVQPLPQVATTAQPPAAPPVAPVTRPGAFEDSDDATEDEVGDDAEGRGEGKRTRSRRRSASARGTYVQPICWAYARIRD